MKSHLCFDVPKILQNIKRCSGNMCEMCQLTSFLHPISYKYGNSRSHYITDLLYLQKTITLNHWSVLPQKNGPTVLPYKKKQKKWRIYQLAMFQGRSTRLILGMVIPPLIKKSLAKEFGKKTTALGRPSPAAYPLILRILGFQIAPQ